MNKLTQMWKALPVLALLTTACGTPGWVDGIVDDQPFEIRDNMPAAREASRGTMLVVLSQEDGETLRVTSIHIPRYADLELGAPVALAVDEDEGPVLSVSEGDLEVTDRGDGARILSSTNNRITTATTGTLTLEALDDEIIAGRFEADLDGRGHVDGSFAIAR